ncbi:hypothetical protein GIB67_006537 [Kingdonia uniflora]|uniref:Uncharacterized protein n=1 Tax=Kingdonia uniflora TaxID=39325 RepID=A0A7J7LEV4_9MAGN|nr:hypothetical protein GIB67_006537 [Kingdonia uniflora]
MSLGYCEKSGTKRLRDTLKYNIWCNDGKVFSPKRYDTSNRFSRIDGSVQESRTAYWETPNRQRFGERCISTPSPLPPNTENQKKKRRVKEREILTDDSITAEGGKDKRKAVTRSLNCKLRGEAEIEEFFKTMLLGPIFSRASVERQPFMVDLYLTLPIFYARINCKVSRKESIIDAIAREGTELKAVLKELEISWFKRVASKDDKVSRSQAKRRMAAKTSGSMEEKLSTPELNTPLKLARLNEIPDGPVDMATVSSTVVQNLAKRKAAKRGAPSRSVMSDSMDDSSKMRKVTSPTKAQVVLEESDKIAEGEALRPRFEVEAGLLEEQCRAKAREKMVAIMDDELEKFARALRGIQLGFKDWSIDLEKRISQLEGEKNQLEGNLTRKREAFQLELEKEREAAALKLKEVRAESIVEAERLVTASATSQNNLAGMLYQLMYTKAEIMAFSEGNYGRRKLWMKRRLRKWRLEIESSRLRVVDLEGLLEVKKKSSAELQGFGFKQLTSELVELREKAVSGSRNEAELVEYRIRVSNEEISDMKCNIHALNEQLLKREIDLDTAQTNLAMSEADCEKLTSSIMRKDQELCNSAQIRDSLIARSVRRVVQREKETNKRINQLCTRISKSEQELRVREMKYQKDLKFELDKRDGEIAFGEGSREMKEFLCRKEELVDNMRIDITNSRQKSIDLTRQMS